MGLAGSYAFDFPTGAAMVMAFALCLVLAALLKVLLFVGAAQRRANRKAAARTMVAILLLTILASSLWLIIAPTADQPVLAAFESATGLGPVKFLNPGDRDTYESAARDMVRFQLEVDRLNAKEKASRYQGLPLSDEEIRRIASYQQSFNEMTRGERFVQDVLRGKARMRERWFIGLPAAIVTLLALGFLTRPYGSSRRRRRRGAPSQPCSGPRP